MTTFYTNLRDGVAHKQLVDKGLTMVIRKRTNTFDEDTGTVSAEKDADHSTVGIIFPQKVDLRADSSGATKNTKTLLVSATGLTVVPEVEDIIVFGDREHIVIAVEPISPGGIDVVYEVMVSY